MQKFKSLHVNFFQWDNERFSQPPLSFTGDKFEWLDWKPLVDIMHQCWPVVKQYMYVNAGLLCCMS
jgi:hypothetical protein